jgi:hypothetical protein
MLVERERGTLRNLSRSQTMNVNARTIRYAIVVRLANVRADHPDHYVGREGVLSSPGQVTRFVSEAKTWGTEKGARGWIAKHPEWLAYRQRNGGSVDVVPVLMSRRQKTVPFDRA